GLSGPPKSLLHPVDTLIRGGEGPDLRRVWPTAGVGAVDEGVPGALGAARRRGQHVVSDAAAAYIASVPPGRRETIVAVRDLVNANLQPGFEEGTGGATGMIKWAIPLDLSPRTYNDE